MQHRPTETTTPRPPADTRHPQVQQAFRTTKIILLGYLLIGLVLLMIDTAMAARGHGDGVSSFMWGRSGGVIASGAVFLRFADAAARGQRWAYRRIRIVAVAVPIIITALLFTSGAAPMWFKIAQLVCAAGVGVIAVVVNGARVRRAFA
jgi:hypothetical protein